MAAWWHCGVDTFRGLVLLFNRIKQTDLSFEETLISFCFLIGSLTFYTLGLVRNDIGSAVPDNVGTCDSACCDPRWRQCHFINPALGGALSTIRPK